MSTGSTNLLLSAFNIWVACYFTNHYVYAYCRGVEWSVFRKDSQFLGVKPRGDENSFVPRLSKFRVLTIGTVLFFRSATHPHVVVCAIKF